MTVFFNSKLRETFYLKLKYFEFFPQHNVRLLFFDLTVV